MGSPPHGRGKGVCPYLLSFGHGITPAWAGKRVARRCAPLRGRDHPRMGGEKAKNPQVCLAGLRITPAWAGKSSEKNIVQMNLKDHPRMGGEKYDWNDQNHGPSGSPPHGRGKASILLEPLNLLGITPAWAGKRLKRSHRSGIFISGPIPFHSALHRPAGSGGSRAGRDGSPAGQPQNAGPA